MLPCLSAISPCGPELGVFKEYSLNSPVFGSSRPSLFAPCPVYHREPSGAIAGSCGRDFGVGTSYSWICTFSIPTVVEPASVVASVNKHSLSRDIGHSPSQKIVVLRWGGGGPSGARHVRRLDIRTAFGTPVSETCRRRECGGRPCQGQICMR